MRRLTPGRWIPGGLVIAVLLALAAVWLAGLGGASEGDPARPPQRTVAGVAAPTEVPASGATVRPERPRPGLWRARQLQRLKATRTVEGVLRRAWLGRRIDPREYARYRQTWARARAAADRLSGVRGVEQRAAVALVAGLARDQELRPSRLPLAFLTLRRNTSFWSNRGPPRGAQRFLWGKDPLVLRYEPGQGLHVHWLGTWGRANGRARFCLERPARCPRASVTRELDRLVSLASERSGYAAYENLFRYSGSAPAWVSGMVQGTAVQALARGRQALDAPRFGRAARRALGAFEQPPPAGIAVPENGGHRFVMYSFDPSLRILNGELQAVTGLFDAAELTGSRRARRLFDTGDRAARAAIPGFDTGAWSLYSAQGAEASLDYHQLIEGFLRNLCRRTGRQEYCAADRRFRRYQREPTRIALNATPEPRLGRVTPIAFGLSKRSQVVVEVRGARGLAFRRALAVSRGRHVVDWTPERSGGYVVQIVAQGPSGPPGRRNRSVRVSAPRPPGDRERGSKRRSSADRTPSARFGRARAEVPR